MYLNDPLDFQLTSSKKKDSDVSLLSEDVGDDRERILIDATPPVAAKTLRRARKKPRSSTDLLRVIKTCCSLRLMHDAVIVFNKANVAVKCKV